MVLGTEIKSNFEVTDFKMKCSILSTSKFSAILDLFFPNWRIVVMMAKERHGEYKKVDRKTYISK